MNRGREAAFGFFVGRKGHSLVSQQRSGSIHCLCVCVALFTPMHLVGWARCNAGISGERWFRMGRLGSHVQPGGPPAPHLLGSTAGEYIELDYESKQDTFMMSVYHIYNVLSVP